MRSCRLLMVLLAAGGILAALPAGGPPILSAKAAETAPPDNTASLERPEWQVGDTWEIETLTEKIQGREAAAAGKAARVRWQFRVMNFEKLGGHDCYRIDVACQAEGRVRPKTTMWCDKDTLFLRQFQTQVAFDGQYRTIQESYDCPKGQYAPVVASVSALPLGMPAFLPKGSKGDETFTYVSQPLPSGSKDPSIIRFAHTLKQEIRPAGAKSLEMVPRTYAKAFEVRPVVEVTITDQGRKVVQLWQKGVPWPVYVKQGPTQAWLVSTSRSSQ